MQGSVCNSSNRNLAVSRRILPADALVYSSCQPMPDAKTAALNTKRRFASYAVSLHCFQIFAVMQKDEHSNEYSSGFCPIYSTAVTVIIVVHELNARIVNLRTGRCFVEKESCARHLTIVCRGEVTFWPNAEPDPWLLQYIPAILAVGARSLRGEIAMHAMSFYWQVVMLCDQAYSRLQISRLSQAKSPYSTSGFRHTWQICAYFGPCEPIGGTVML
jgi:hypothetical protein